MHETRRIRSRTRAPRFAAALLLTLLASPMALAAPHVVECGGRSGIDLARCQRHQKMAERCGPLKGEAHVACDREFLLANPLDCDAWAGDDARGCRAERAAFKSCESHEGMPFMRCVRDAAKASPMGDRH